MDAPNLIGYSFMLKDSFGTSLLALGAALAYLTVWMIIRPRQSAHYFLLVYALLVLFKLIFYLCYYPLSITQPASWLHYSFQEIFMLSEWICFYFIIQRLLKSSRLQRIHYRLFLLVIMVSLLVLLLKENSIRGAGIFSVMIAAFQQLACVLYFIDRIYSTETTSLRKDPGFWMIAGIFMHSSGFIPAMLAFEILSDNLQRFRPAGDPILFTLYILLFLSFLKSLLCSRKQKNYLYS